MHDYFTAETPLAAASLQPMKVVTILDRGFGILKQVIGRVKFLLFIYAAVTVTLVIEPHGQEMGIHDHSGSSVLSQALIVFTSGTLALCFKIIITRLAALAWQSKSFPESLKQEISIGIFIKVVALSTWIIMVTIVLAAISFVPAILIVSLVSAVDSDIKLFSILLLPIAAIPAIIYFVNRVLAYYALVADDLSISEALKKSKFLMTRGSWYKLSSPVMRISGLYIVIIIISFITGGVFGAGALLSVLWKTSMTASVIILLAIGQVINIIFQMYSVIVLTGFYYDLRARYEGMDLLETLSRIEAKA
ncbi:MAG: hypothetical protein D6719_06700 [Candidatus Dadabacteria bacterium]|nr:MAG: hypothetical protein D6719_06700 [Candidatus Dadabacteria bacterium]